MADGDFNLATYVVDSGFTGDQPGRPEDGGGRRAGDSITLGSHSR
jgi:hypothetical protein